MTTDDMSKERLGLGIVGTGQMGRGIAQIAAASGIDVFLNDAQAGAAAKAQGFVAGMLRRLVEKGRMDPAAAEAAVERVTVVDDLEPLAGMDVVIEAIIEDLEIKRQLFDRLEAIVGDSCILATNTSSLSVTRIAGACRRPDRVAGFHFFNPVPLMRVVEVVPGVRTRADVVESLVALAERMGHRPVVAKDTPGFLVNHAGRGFGTEALRILSEGVARPVDIDRVMREAAGFPMGPFELFDLTGLDVSHPVMESIYRQFYEEPRFRPSPETRRRLDAGLLGRKVDEGWYGYRGNNPQAPDDEPAPEDRPSSVWISRREPVGAAAVEVLMTKAGATVETEDTPSSSALVVLTPLGNDATTEALDAGVPPAQCVAVDTLLGLDKRMTLMTTPATTAAHRRAAHGAFAASGRPVTLIADSPGFIAQRILAAIVNVASEIAQQGIASTGDIDAAVRLGLGYPKGPLAWGDALGPLRVLAILERLQAITGDPRYRPSLWLRRRARLGLPLHAPDVPD